MFVTVIFAGGVAIKQDDASSKTVAIDIGCISF